MKKFLLFLLTYTLIANVSIAETNSHNAVTKSISTSELKDFNRNSPQVQKLISQALKLTTQHLTYTYGSADPKNGGMDCSGTIYYLLKNSAVKNVPRASDGMYLWVAKQGHLHAVTKNDFDSAQFSQLKPGDLLFWSGTYKVKRAIPVTHVMLYLGKNKQDQPLMFGSSNGRTYQRKSMWGVSVFDFQLPNNKSSSHFLGYSCIPNLICM